jgi:GNAT superfamily N-acetyltransferase
MEDFQSITIRRAIFEDIHHIAKLQINAWQAAYCKEAIDTAIQQLFINTLGKRWMTKLQNGYDILVLETEKGLMGFISVLFGTDPDDSVVIDGLHVNPPTWRQGFGRMLCQAAFAEIKKNGFTSASTWLFEGNRQMEMFYHSLGFESTATYKSNDLGEGISSREIRYNIVLA